MIIACPACTTRYVVPDSAIGAEGRTVRCAKCRHSWYQDPPPLEMPPRPEVQPAPVPQAEPAQAEQAEHTAAADAELPPAPPPAHPPIVETASPSPRLVDDGGTHDAPSQFDAAPPFRRRRNPLRLWSWAAGIFGAVAIGAIAAVSWWGLPDWVSVNRPTFGAGQPSLQLDFPAERQERRQLPNGTEYFGASGTVTNTSGEAQRVPSILIVLRDSRERIVYSWEVQPPKRTLAPGESVTVNEAVTDVPRSARFAEIGWKPD